MPLEDIVDVTISSTGPAVTSVGFGTPLILAAHTRNADRIRFYEDLAGMVDDGFTTDDEAYRMASAVFSQNPRPQRVAVGRRANQPTQRWALTPTAENAATYTVEVDGVPATFTSDADATVAEIIAGLKAAIDALGKAVTTTDQVTFLRVVANAAGAFFGLESTTPTRLALAQDHADAGVAADLDAIQLVNDSWYVILHPFNSRAELTAIAAWAEAHNKLFIAQTQDTVVATGGYDATGAADVGSDLDRLGYARTALIYHPDSGAFADAAWAGRVLPLDPGSETWKFKSLAGVAAAVLTGTQRTNLRAKSTNFYETLAGLAITQDGVVSAGEFIDVVRGRDWLQARLREDVFGRLANAQKVPFTDAGIAIVEAAVRARLKNAVDIGFLSSNPEPTVSVPRAADVPEADRAARLLPQVSFDATVAGAIHRIRITGRITV
jgi:hypothetical protein